MEREDVVKNLNNVRRSVIRLLLSFSAMAMISYFFWKEILGFIQKPLGMSLVYYSIPEAFLTSVRIALFAGVFLSAPFMFNEIWSSIAPFFTPHSRRYSPWVIGSASLLFYAGGIICYLLLLPAGIKFLIGYQTDHIIAAISVESYISFFASMIFGFGLAFEMPLVMLLLGKAGIVNAAILRKYRRYAILVIVIASAIITPTPDLLNLSLMAAPLFALYELSIILVMLFGAEKTRTT
ncbi:MAG: twin-arginine translocase subunit TatC [Deltaproteobacteria bacterium]|nr:twin-arginine translocase subunit TatC [Deltaproteobacteria bacterium]